MKRNPLKSLIGQCELTAQTLKQLAHPQRLQLLCHLSAGERTVSELQGLCGCSQSQLSQFLGRMKGEKLVASRREGKCVFYRIHDPKALEIIQALHAIFCPK